MQYKLPLGIIHRKICGSVTLLARGTLYLCINKEVACNRNTVGSIPECDYDQCRMLLNVPSLVGDIKHCQLGTYRKIAHSGVDYHTTKIRAPYDSGNVISGENNIGNNQGLRRFWKAAKGYLAHIMGTVLLILSIRHLNIMSPYPFDRWRINHT